MPRATPGLISFTAGELSPLLEGRTDYAKYGAGCYKMENFIVTVQGPARKRPGTRFVAEVKNSADRCWLTSFSFSAAQSYMLEWGDHYLRFFKNYAPVLSAGVPYEIATPYGVADLTDSKGLLQLVFVQSADVIYITHRSKTIPVYKLSRFGDTNWTLAAVDAIAGPFAPENSGSNPIVYASGQTGTGITLYASADIFDADRMGSFFQLRQKEIRDIRPWQAAGTVSKGQRRRYNGVTYEAITGAGGSPYTTGYTPPTHLHGTAWDNLGPAVGVLWEYRDAGYGYVQLKVRGADPAAATPIAITGITSASPPVVTLASAVPYNNGDLVFITGVSGMSEVNDKFFIVSAKAGATFALQQAVTGGAPANVDGANFDAYVSGGTVSPRIWTATADVVTQSESGTVNRLPSEVVGSQNATNLWAYGAWSAHDGYPAVVAFFRGRLALGRDGDRWFSVAQDFENFSARTPGGEVTADMAISITEPVEDTIHWMLEGRVLLEGTEGGESVVQEINAGQAFGPANVGSPKRQLRNGSRGVIPAVVSDTVFYVQTSGRKVRASKYAFASDNYESSDITAPSEHITKSGVIQMAFAKEPDSLIWMARGDGGLIGLTFNEEQQISGWHRHPLREGDSVESVAAMPAPDGSRDDLWLIVKRMISGATKRHVEYLSAYFDTGDDLATDAFYVDSATVYAGAPATVISGLGHLEGATVRVLADGSATPDTLVSGGQITLERAASNVLVGLPYKAKLTTMPLEAGSATGTAQGKTKRVSAVRFRFFNTLGGRAGRDGSIMDNTEFRQPSDPMDQAVPVFSGIWPPDNPMPWPYGYEQEARLTYENDDPFPATIVGIYPSVESND